MKEAIKESKNILKRFLERRKNIRKEMTNIGRVFDSITMILSITIIIIILVSEFSFSAFEIGFGLIVLIFIFFLPFSLIESKIYKKASKKYKSKLKEQRLKFCMYCGGKLDSFQNFCPFCGRTFNQTAKIITNTTEIEKNLQEEYYKEGKPLAEQKEIINQSRNTIYKIFLITFNSGLIVVSIIIVVFFSTFQILPFLITLLLLFNIFIFILVYMMNSMFIFSRFLITTEDIKLYIEKKLYLQINWSEIDKIDIYRVRFHGFYLKINYSNSYQIISLEYCDYGKSKQKDIIKSLFLYSGDLKNKISVMKTSIPILDEVGIKDLYEDLYNFARAQRFVFHRSKD